MKSISYGFFLAGMVHFIYFMAILRNNAVESFLSFYYEFILFLDGIHSASKFSYPAAEFTYQLPW